MFSNFSVKLPSQWVYIASLWGLWYFGIFISSDENYNQKIIWGGALLVGLATFRIFNKTFRWRHMPPEVQLLGLFWLWSFTGFMVAVDSELFFNYSRQVFQFVVILLLVSFLIANSGVIKPFLVGFIAAGAGLALKSASGLETGISLESTKELQRVAQASGVGFLGLIGIMAGFSLFPEVRSKLFRGALLIGIAGSLYGLVLSASRSAFIMLFVFIIIWLIISGKTIVRSKLLFIVIIVALLLLFYFLYQFVISDTNLGRRMLLLSASEKDGSTLERLDLMFAAWDMFLEYPIFGAGLGQYGYASGFGMYAHVELAEIFGTTGLIGVVIYYSMYYVTWRRLIFLRRITKDQLMVYRINSALVFLLILFISGLFFRINVISLDSMFLYAYVLGVSLWAWRGRKVAQLEEIHQHLLPLRSNQGVLDKRQ